MPTKVDFTKLSLEFHDAFWDLREHLYRQGQGAWYTAVCTLSADGRLSFEFDHDSEPAWDIDVVPATYAEDLELYPRPEDQRPAWLQAKLHQAGR